MATARSPSGRPGVPVVTAPEELDITNAPHLEWPWDAAAKGHGSFVVDMSQTRFCDIAGLHVLLEAHKLARADGGGLVLAVGGKAVMRLFEITALDRMIPTFTSLDQALAHARANGLVTRRRACGQRPTTAAAHPRTSGLDTPAFP